MVEISSTAHMVEEAIQKILEFPETKVTAIDRDNFVAGDAKILQKKYPKRFDFHQKNLAKFIKL